MGCFVGVAFVPELRARLPHGAVLIGGRNAAAAGLAGAGQLFAPPPSRTEFVNHVVFVVVTSGAMTLARVTPFAVPGGGLAIIDFLLPWTLTSAHAEAEVIALFVERSRFGPDFQAALEHEPIIMPPSHPGARGIGAFARATWAGLLEHGAGPAVSDAAGDHVDGAARALAAMTPHLVSPLRDRAARRPATATGGRLPALCQFIDRHLFSDALTPDLIAGEFGLSRAVLYRTFEPLGGVTSFIRRRRLAWARAQLEAETASPAAIAHVAQRLGFASVAAFSRAYKDQFGHSPARHRLGVRRSAPMRVD